MKQKNISSSLTCSRIASFLLIIFVLSLLIFVAIFITQQTQVAGLQKTIAYSAIYQGVYTRDLSASNLTKLTAFESDVGKKAAIVMWFQAWGAPNEKDFNTLLMTAVRNHGSIPLVTWEPRDVTQGADQPQYALQNIINGTFDSYISTFALDAKAWGHPFFLRFAHEMNDQWVPWSEQVNGNKAGQYIQAWRHVHDIFRAKGVTNVTWVWCPGVSVDINSFRELYPGDRYVDWVCMDGYNYRGDHWTSFFTIFNRTYQNLRTITSKPQMIAETGSPEQGGSKAAWITDAYSQQLPIKFPNIKAIIWFNVDQTKEQEGIDWRIESSPAAQHAFATALKSSVYATNQYSSLVTSPIPIPEKLPG